MRIAKFKHFTICKMVTYCPEAAGNALISFHFHLPSLSPKPLDTLLLQVINSLESGCVFPKPLHSTSHYKSCTSVTFQCNYDLYLDNKQQRKIFFHNNFQICCSSRFDESVHFTPLVKHWDLSPLHKQIYKYQNKLLHLNKHCTC